MFLAGFVGISLLAGTAGFAYAQTTPTIEELSVQVQSLLKILNQLQVQVQQLQNTGSTGINYPMVPTYTTMPTSTVAPPPWCHTFSSNLRFGDKGVEVKALYEAFVKESGLMRATANPDGPFEFNEAIASAVVGFQERYKNEILTPNGLKFGTGFVGVSTRAKLNALYGCGVSHPIGTTPPIIGTMPALIDEGRDGFVLTNFNEGAPTLYAGKTYTVSWENRNNVPITGLAFYLEDTSVSPFRIYSVGNLNPETGDILSASQTRYVFTVPSDVRSGDDYRISVTGRIANVTHMGIADDSDAKLQIFGSGLQLPTDPSTSRIKILSPNGGESWSLSEQHTIQWTGWVPEKGREIYAVLMDNTNIFALNVLNPHGDGISVGMNPAFLFNEATVTLPSAIKAGAYKLQLTMVEGNTRVFDESDGYISIVASQTLLPSPSIKILSPNGGETWKAGPPIQMEIRWSSVKEIPGFNLALYKGGVFQRSMGIQNVNAQISQSGNVTQHLTYWPIPAEISEGNDYRIRISSAMNGNVFDESDNYFSIVSLQNTITSCILGDVNMDGVITIVDSQFIAQYVAGNRTFTDDQKWRADVNGDGMISSSDAEYISNYVVGNVSAPSGTCSVPMEQSITVVAPNGGEVLEEGRTHQIRWMSHGVKSVHIGYAIGGKGYELADVEANRGYYAWSIPADFVESFARNFGTTLDATKNSMSVMVSSNDSGTRVVSDKSDAPFSIVPSVPTSESPSITIRTPAKGVIWETGSVHTINWTSVGIPATANVSVIELERNDGGEGWHLAYNTPNDGAQTIYVPNVEGDFRIAMSVLVGNAYQTYQSDVFHITKEHAKGTFDLGWNRLEDQLKVPSSGATLASLNVSAFHEDVILDDIRVDFDGSKDAFRAMDDLKNVYLMIGDTKVGGGSSFLGDTNNHWKTTYRLTDGKTVAVRVIGDVSSSAIDGDSEIDTIRVDITVRGTGARSGAAIEANKATGQSILLVAGDKSLALTSPNGGEELELAKSYQIKWNSAGSVGPLDIYLMKESIARYTLAFQTANDGLFDWTIGKDSLGQTIAPGEYRVKILETLNQQIFDQSDNGFAIIDAATPVRSDGKPAGTLSSGTKEVTLSLSTDETARCLYATQPGIAYDPKAGGAMDQVNAQGTRHEGYLRGLSDGKTYTYYVRCRDSAQNTNDSDFAISFSVASPDVSSVLKFGINTASPNGTLIPGPSTLLAVFDVTNNGLADVTFANEEGNSLTVAISQSALQEDGNTEAITLKDENGTILDTATANLGASPTTVMFDFANKSFVVPSGSVKKLYIYGDTMEFLYSGDAIQLWLDSSNANNINWGLDGSGNYGHADIIFRGNPYAFMLVRP